VIDEERANTASRAAAGLINPVTGRRIVTTWMIDELLAFVPAVYDSLRGVLGASFFEPVTIADFFPTPQMRLAFLKRLAAGGAYLSLPGDEHFWDDSFHPALGFGLISPCYLVDMPGLLSAERRRLREKRVLLEEAFAADQLVVETGRVRYKDLVAERVIFCDGVAGFSNPYFSRLPFAPNKGEALIVEIDGLPADRAMVFKKGISLVPWAAGSFWVGSSYEWDFGHEQPTEAFRSRAEAALREWLKLPFRTVDHLASVRPATLERRPFVGFHPIHPAVGILNGMGTKGCSLAPYFARALVLHMAAGTPIAAEADVRRFAKVLSRR